MTIEYIAGRAVELPVRFTAGHRLTEQEALVLNRIYLARLNARLRWRIDRNEIDKDMAPAEAIRMAEEFTFSEADIDPADEQSDNDPVLLEGLEIAKELIRKEMAESGIIEVPNLDHHARALYDASPAIKDRAKKRCEIRWRAMEKTFGDSA